MLQANRFKSGDVNNASHQKKTVIEKCLYNLCSKMSDINNLKRLCFTMREKKKQK